MLPFTILDTEIRIVNNLFSTYDLYATFGHGYQILIPAFWLTNYDTQSLIRSIRRCGIKENDIYNVVDHVLFVMYDLAVDYVYHLDREAEILFIQSYCKYKKKTSELNG